MTSLPDRALVVFGGYNGAYLNDVWRLEVTKQPKRGRSLQIPPLPTAANFTPGRRMWTGRWSYSVAGTARTVSATRGSWCDGHHRHLHVARGRSLSLGAAVVP